MARNAVAADHSDAHHTTRTADPHSAPPAQEAQSAGRGARHLVCRVARAQDELARPSSAASCGEERGVEAGQEAPHLPEQSVRDVSRPAPAARTSGVLPARQLQVNAMVRRPASAERSKEPELEP